MKVGGIAYRSIWVDDDARSVKIIDQTRLPFEFVTLRLQSLDAAAEAIASMQVRGAPLIGVTAAYGVCLQMRADPSDAALQAARKALLATRPTGRNLRWALDAMGVALDATPPAERERRAIRGQRSWSRTTSAPAAPSVNTGCS